MTTPALRSAARVLPILALAAAFASALPATASADGPLHSYQAEGSASDSAGTSNGTLFPGGNYTTGHDSAQAFSLSGANQYVSIAPDPTFYPSASFSVSAWVQTSVAAGIAKAVDMDECAGASVPPACASALSTWQLGAKDGKPYAFVRDSNGGGLAGDDRGQRLVGTNAPTIADSAWHQLTLVKDVAAGRISLYSDGYAVAEQELAAGASGSLDNLDAETDPVVIGAQLDGPSFNAINEWSGAIDDVNFWSSAQYPDKTPPVINVQVLGDVTADGWYTGEITAVRWDVRDESVIRNDTGCGATDLTDDGVGLSATCTATSAGGTSVRTVTIKRDSHGPTLTCDQISPYYAVGDKDTMSATAADALSGVATPTVSKAIDTETKGAHSVVLSLEDKAANPGSVACPYTVVVPIVKKVTLATVATAPGPKACVKGRKVGLRVKAGLKPQVAKAQFAVAGRTIKTVTGAALAKPISLTKLPSKGRYRVTVTLTDVKANKRVASRIYKACAVKKSKAKKKKKK